MSKVVERIVNAERLEDIIAVFGSFDENIRRIEDALVIPDHGYKSRKDGQNVRR